MYISFHLHDNCQIKNATVTLSGRFQWVSVEITDGELTFFTQTIEDAHILEEAFKRLIK